MTEPQTQRPITLLLLHRLIIVYHTPAKMSISLWRKIRVKRDTHSPIPRSCAKRMEADGASPMTIKNVTRWYRDDGGLNEALDSTRKVSAMDSITTAGLRRKSRGVNEHHSRKEVDSRTVDVPEHEEARAENRGESGVAQSRLVVTNFLPLTQKQLLTSLWDSAKNHGERERARRAAEGLHTDYKYV